MSNDVVASVWAGLYQEAVEQVCCEPVLDKLLQQSILCHDTFHSACKFKLVSALVDENMDALEWSVILDDLLQSHAHIVTAAAYDLQAILQRDPAAQALWVPFLYHKGYLALQIHRVAHALWVAGREGLALFLQSVVSRRLSMDIHPAAKIGEGIMIDHGTGIVIGQTAVVENNVSLLHNVTLGGTGKELGDRHPKIREGVLIGAGATILGNIEIGRCAKIAAGSVVLAPVAEWTTVAGVPAKVVTATTSDAMPAFDMHQTLD